MHARFVNAGGIRTRLLECGDKRPVLLLHPVGFSADVWFKVLPGLGEHTRSVAPDLLGHGFTDFYDPNGRIGHKAIFEHLTALVDELGWDEFSVVGSSFGGQMAVLLALAMPRRVSRLVVVGSATALQTEKETMAALAGTLANASKALDAPTWESCRARLGNLCFDPAQRHDEIILSQLTAYARDGAAAAYKTLLAAMLDADAARPYRVRERLSEVEAPTLIVWGREDQRASHQRAEEGVHLFKDARLVTIERCGHMPFLEHPERFTESTLSFLTQPQGAAIRRATA
ncbi:alpha/beta fold hydrolase [Pseudorhodoplanes sp.]|uniref:alpha/beta fold hydrolase n=1 Tax=Pseudorhodoplanes sp. TaxID=1934341 RepID=UPI003D11E546